MWKLSKLNRYRYDKMYHDMIIKKAKINVRVNNRGNAKSIHCAK